MTDMPPQQQQMPEPDVTDPAKLIRLGTMVQSLLAEVGEATQDEGGRKRLAAIHQETIEELSEILSEDLREELLEFNNCCAQNESPSAGELRVAQAQLVGWMQGLLRGMQASAQAQAAMAQRQLQQVQMGMQQPGRPGGGPGQPGLPSAPPAPPAGGGGDDLPGYL